MKRILKFIGCLALAFIGAGAYADPVATVGTTSYETIDEAIAAWEEANNSTLTLKADVTLPRAVKLLSTTMHTLNLASYTMTAASKQHAIEITPNGRGSAGGCLTINADGLAGKIYAPGKCCVYYYASSGKDRPIITFNNGTFEGDSVVSVSKTNGTNCPQLTFNNGLFIGTSLFNGCVNSNRSLIQVNGGDFRGMFYVSADTSAYCRIGGGMFDSIPSTWDGTPAVDKFCYATTKTEASDVYVYFNEDGRFVVSKTLPECWASLPTPKSGTLARFGKPQVYFKDAACAFEKTFNSPWSASAQTLTLYADSDAGKAIAGGRSLTVVYENGSKYTGKVTSSSASYVIVKTVLDNGVKFESVSKANNTAQAAIDDVFYKTVAEAFADAAANAKVEIVKDCGVDAGTLEFGGEVKVAAGAKLTVANVQEFKGKVVIPEGGDIDDFVVITDSAVGYRFTQDEDGSYTVKAPGVILSKVEPEKVVEASTKEPTVSEEVQKAIEVGGVTEADVDAAKETKNAVVEAAAKEIAQNETVTQVSDDVITATVTTEEGTLKDEIVVEVQKEVAKSLEETIKEMTVEKLVAGGMEKSVAEEKVVQQAAAIGEQAKKIAEEKVSSETSTKNFVDVSLKSVDTQILTQEMQEGGKTVVCEVETVVCEVEPVVETVTKTEVSLDVGGPDPVKESIEEVVKTPLPRDADGNVGQWLPVRLPLNSKFKGGFAKVYHNNFDDPIATFPVQSADVYDKTGNEIVRTDYFVEFEYNRFSPQLATYSKLYEPVALPGDGSAERPYKITCQEDLEFFRAQVNAGTAKYTSAHVVLDNDIDFVGEWDSGIGGIFRGVFDGQDHTISNLKIAKGIETDTYSYAALFHTVYGPGENDFACVRNLTLSNVNVTAEGEYVAAISGDAQFANFENCKVIGGSITGLAQVGGICGFTRSCNVTGCLVENVTISAVDDRAAGIVGGKMQSGGSIVGNTVKDCTITSGGYHTDYCGAAGLVGQIHFVDGTAALITDNEILNVTTKVNDETIIAPIGNFRCDCDNKVSATTIARNHWAPATEPDSCVVHYKGDELTINNFHPVAQIEGKGLAYRYENVWDAISAAAALPSSETEPVIVQLYPGVVQTGDIYPGDSHNLSNVIIQGAADGTSTFKDCMIHFMSSYDNLWKNVTFKDIVWDASYIQFSTFKSENLTFDGNTFVNQTRSGSIGGVHFTAKCRDLTYVNNKFEGGTAGSIAAINASAGTLTGNITINNNIIRNSNWRSLQLMFDSNDGVPDIFTITDNWFVGNKYEYQLYGSGTESSDDVQWNINYNVFDDASTADTMTIKMTNPEKTAFNLDHNHYVKNPSEHPDSFWVVNGDPCSAGQIVDYGVYPYFNAYYKDELAAGTKTVRESLYDLVDPAAYVANANGKFVKATLADAIGAATPGESIVLMRATDEAVSLKTGVVLDLNGKSFDVTKLTLEGDSVLVDLGGGKYVASCAELIRADGSIGYYATLQAAIDAAKAGWTIRLDAAFTGAANGGAVPFVLEKNDKAFSGTITPAEGFKVVENPVDGTVRYMPAAEEPILAAGMAKIADGFYQDSPTYKSEGLNYYITDVRGLAYYRDLVNNKNGELEAYRALPCGTGAPDKTGNYRFKGHTVTLLSDVDLDNILWTPIGYPQDDRDYMAGTFDGGNHVVSNLKVEYSGESNDYRVGFFGYACGDSTQIKNLTIENVDVKGFRYVAGLIGCCSKSTALIENCHLTGLVSLYCRSDWVGGIVGQGYCSVRNCSVEGDDGSNITVWGGGIRIGGIFGNDEGADSVIEDCLVSNLTISVAQNYIAGGIAGSIALGAKVSRCHVEKVSIQSERGPYLGYVVGGFGGGSGVAVISDCTVADSTLTCNRDKFMSEQPNTYYVQCGDHDNLSKWIVGSGITVDENGKVTGGVFENIPEQCIAPNYLKIDLKTVNPQTWVVTPPQVTPKTDDVVVGGLPENPSDEIKQQVAAETNKVIKTLSGDNITKFADTDVAGSSFDSYGNPKQDVVVALQNATNKQAVRDAIAAQLGESNSNERVEITLDKFEFEVQDQSATLSVVEYDVKPWIKVTTIVDNVETVTEAIIPNEALVGHPLTFRLAVNDNFGQYAKVIHTEGTTTNETYLTKVFEDATGGKYVQLKSDRFSNFFLYADVTEPKCKVGDQFYNSVQEAIEENADVPDAVFTLTAKCSEMGLPLKWGQEIDVNGQEFTGSIAPVNPAGESAPETYEQVKTPEGRVFSAPTRVAVSLDASADSAKIKIRIAGKDAEALAAAQPSGRPLWQDLAMGSTVKLIPQVLRSDIGSKTITIRGNITDEAVEAAAKQRDGVSVKYQLMKKVGAGSYVQFGEIQPTPVFSVQADELEVQTFWKIQTIFSEEY